MTTNAESERYAFIAAISVGFDPIIKLLHALEEVQAGWAVIKFEGTYSDAMNHSVRFSTYKQTIKRNWVTEKQDLTTLFSNVQTKLRTYGLREYLPPPGLAPAVCTTLMARSHLSHLNRNARISTVLGLPC